MAKKYLLLNQGNEHWRLPDDTDLVALRSDIAAAMESGSVLEIPVILAFSKNPIPLLFNGKAAPLAVVTEG